MAETKDSFFGANIIEEGDDLKMASGVVFGEAVNIDVKDLTIRLRVFDGETKEARIVEIVETETWDWKNPGTWRVINGWQVTSYSALLSILHQKQLKGIEEIEMLEAPRFSMLSGG
ncbi:MAG: hypothetical protein C0392_09150 [Syntrophus sp. (in: bacteria)]|nr:hypothetical protein [Syntrophus sp. (in: bacteria)]